MIGQDTTDRAPRTRRLALVLGRIVALVVLLVGLAMVVGGIELLLLGGSAYYLIVGAIYLLGGGLMWRSSRRRLGMWLVVLALAVTVPWALVESGLHYWPLFPRLLMPAGLAVLALIIGATAVQGPARRSTLWLAAGLGILTAVGFGGAFFPHDQIAPSQGTPFTLGAGDNRPSDWSAYGRGNEGTRFAPFNQINRDNVSQLQVAWTFHSGDKGPGIDQNTPLQIGDTLYTCSRNDKIAALDADTGKLRWQYTSGATSPIWQRCRSLGYYEDKAAIAQAGPTGHAPLCARRLLNTTVDARLIALDAATGKLCPAFGDNGMVDLKQGMGPVNPGFYFQTSAPLVARDNVIIGGFVVDNQEVGEPSGVIRAFDARSGKLSWAWDLGNPGNSGAPLPGKSYTRATPNMWTTAAYDDKLGLVYLPLGNQTPDYYGKGRLPQSAKYNSSIVALDVMTGHERWKVQTVHHDIWDYDLPSQPALVDAPDGKGHTVPALLQATKRGQLFLLDRRTGAALANIVEKPVPQTGAVPEERLSPTQPYSVGMPTIGDQRLSERRMWGTTMLDQLWCRIDYHRHRYDGDFTPIGLTRALEQPGNLGGMNWGSLSVDPVNNLAYMVDIRVPTEYWLVKRADFAASAKKYPPDPNGHGPGEQVGTPYGMVTQMWLSPLGVPCNEPPFGTVTAVNLNTRKVAWQVPAGTAERLGPLGIRSHMPMPIGMPSYAGTTATAGGLVFFAGTQDYYLRAYDAKTGREVWKYALPVGSSATPMSYVSPATGRQYVLLSVGGAAHSPDVGDYVMAFALPEKARGQPPAP